MKKILISLIAFLIIFPILFTTKVKAAALQITGLGTMDVTGLDLGGSLTTYTYSGGTFALAGLASPSAVVSVTIDDVSQTATADEEGSWSTLISSLTEGEHQFNISSNAETLDFVLTIGTSVTGGETAEVATTSSTLPEAGSTTASILFLAFAMLSIGLGLTIKAKQS